MVKITVDRCGTYLAGSFSSTGKVAPAINASNVSMSPGRSLAQVRSPMSTSKSKGTRKSLSCPALRIRCQSGVLWFPADPLLYTWLSSFLMHNVVTIAQVLSPATA